MYLLIQQTHRFIRKANRGQMGAYVQALVVLLLRAVCICAVLFTTGCDLTGCAALRGDSTNSSFMSGRVSGGSGPGFRVTMRTNARYARPGERATRTLGVQGTSGTTQVSYRWDPPPGAKNFSYNPAPNAQGPPPVWIDLPPDQKIHISYDQPPLPPGDSMMQAVDTATVDWEGHYSITSFTTNITNDPPTPSAPSTLAAAPARSSAAATTDLWQVDEWVEQEGVTLTKELCQEWFAGLQSDDVFQAVRVPVSPTAALTESYPLPIVFGGKYSNTVQLFSYDPFSPIITVPVELRPEYHTFLENELPSAPGEHWMALGLASDTVTCPDYELAAGRWGFKAQSHLDMTHQPYNCEGCILPTYYCYEGQDTSLVFAAARHALGTSADVTSYPSWGITCVGPQAVPLRHEPAWEFGGASSVWVTPTMPITFHHYILPNLGSDPMTFTLDYTATLGVEWSIYGGDWSEPDTGDPVTPPITATSENPRHLWMISEPVPTDTVAGDYTLIVTATSVVSPADSLWIGDIIWVGDWVAPCSTLDEVSITGPPTTTVGSAATFTAAVSPPTATLPVAYTWGTTGLSPMTHTVYGIHDTAVFTWNTTGPQTVTVRAVNSCGVAVDETRVLTVEAAAPCTALDGASITGPPTTTVGSATTFTAAVSPPTATLPVAYTWEATGLSPMTHTVYGIHDTAVFTWNTTGPQTITVRAVNSCGVAVDETRVITVEAAAPCTALDGASIAGPPTTTVGGATTFTATVGPPMATLPVAYTWEATGLSPVTHTVYSIQDTAVFTWNVTAPAVYTITLTAENCTPPSTVAVSATRTITIKSLPADNYTIYLPLVLRQLEGLVVRELAP